ncbi:MAG TPA: hypothetical protein PLI05_07820 [Methanotrichaceae archaeon]|nr:hypothetical protein [Methanotrichaceae archaeon]HQF16957.1 hypothetical protein [Methanotrichaceae archaeon]HQI91577.1 hypothetical protein [Methanotrichaceae archaeon]HQJ28928.1 hypothetical protein [Methanotrichaceae archaeon]
MKTYISLSGFDTSQIVSLIVKYGIEGGDRLTLIRPENETDQSGESTVQAVMSLSDRSIAPSTSKSTALTTEILKEWFFL